jgi:hypothetical protein
MRVQKDYTKRGQRTPGASVVPSVLVDEAKMGVGSGASQGNIETMIAHEQAMHTRVRRSYVPNKSLNKK